MSSDRQLSLEEQLRIAKLKENGRNWFPPERWAAYHRDGCPVPPERVHPYVLGGCLPTLQAIQDMAELAEHHQRLFHHRLPECKAPQSNPGEFWRVGRRVSVIHCEKQSDHKLDQHHRTSLWP